MSNGLPLLARCQPSIFACRVSRTASSSRFFGARSRMMAASPVQNASGEIPVLGVASLAMKSNRTGAIFSPWASIRFMGVFSGDFLRETAITRCFGDKTAKRAPQRGSFHGPFSAKAGAMRRPFGRPRLPISVAVASSDQSSDIGSEVDQFVEQNACSRQHSLDLVGRLSDRTGRGVNRQLAGCGRLVIVADAGKRMQRAGTRLGVVAFGIAAFADFDGGCDIDLAEGGVGDAARRGSVFG